jgi:acyl-CoA dehydrogenase
VLLAPSEQRDRLTEDVYLPQGNTQPLAQLENALKLASAAVPILERIRQASRAGTLPKAAPETLVAAALQSGVITPTEGRLVEDAAAARRQAIEVDSFSPEEYFGRVASLATAMPRDRETRESLLTT